MAMRSTTSASRLVSGELFIPATKAKMDQPQKEGIGDQR